MTKIEKVREILTKYPESRTSDYDFYWLYVWEYQKKEFMVDINGIWFMVSDRQNMMNLEILNHSILTTRQRLQKKHPELRDERMWNIRHKKGQKDKFEILKIN